MGGGDTGKRFGEYEFAGLFGVVVGKVNGDGLFVNDGLCAGGTADTVNQDGVVDAGHAETVRGFGHGVCAGGQIVDCLFPLSILRQGKRGHGLAVAAFDGKAEGLGIHRVTLCLGEIGFGYLLSYGETADFQAIGICYGDIQCTARRERAGSVLFTDGQFIAVAFRVLFGDGVSPDGHVG